VSTMQGTGSDHPLVSIVIPVYNGSRYLQEAIDSALNQTYRNTEVIVVNDGSRDDGKTETIAKSYGDRISYIAKENGGVATALNLGIAKAKGEYISWLSHDDAYAPMKLENQMTFLNTLPMNRRKEVVLYSHFFLMDENSAVFGRYTVPSVPPEKLYQALLCEMVFRSPLRRRKFGINGCTTLIPKAAFDKVGKFDEKLRTTQDYDMWFRMNRYFDFVLTDDYLLKSRIHREQGIWVLKDVALVEVGELYYHALDYYDPKTPRFDLDLPKVALALKMSPRKKRAYARAKEMLKSRETKKGDLQYIMLARLWNRAFGSVRKMADKIEK
jgi:glycosyltransferase involved in cell wall biosynthesis